jgi:hypothetical protein
MLDSLVRVSRRVVQKHCASAPSAQVQKPAYARASSSALTTAQSFSRGKSPRWPAARADGGPVARSACGRAAPIAAARLPLNNFKHFLTLFPKFFSSFPRGTCSLSVSRQYLALDGIYHPIRAALPSNPTRGQRLVGQQAPGSTGFSPSLTSRSRELGPGPLRRALR